MKRIATYIVSLLALACTSCRQTPVEVVPEAVPGDVLHVEIAVTVPDMPVVTTRSVDPDGLGIQSMTLLCFDRDGLFLSRVKPSALDVHTDQLSGTLSADVPSRTQIIHFLANQNLESSFNDAANRGRHENSVVLELLSTSARVVYWGRVSSVQLGDGDTPSDGDLVATLRNPVMLVRNMAKISFAQGSVEVGGETVNVPFSVTGFAVCNQNSFGTVAPYHVETRSFLWTSDSFYVTLPRDLSKYTDPEELLGTSDEFVFEYANASDDQMYVVVKGRNAGDTEELYYRVLLLDNTTQEPLPIVRNHHYRIVVKERLEGGVRSFAEAKTAPPVNNVWISVEQEIPSVSDGTTTLTVDKTFVVFPGQNVAGQQSVTFRCNATERPEVRWLSNGISSTNDLSGYQFSGGVGTISFTLLPVGLGEQRSGELMIKSGKLQRTIRMLSISQFEFLPCWASTNVDGTTSGDAGGQEVVLLFTIPDNFPEELLPIDVLISANHITPDPELQNLRTVFRQDYLKADGSLDPAWGIDDEDHDFKYVYPITRDMLEQSHRRRVYFRTALNADSDNLTDHIVVENQYFAHVEKTFTYTLNSGGAITLEDMNEYNRVKYTLVAPKKDEPVTVSFTLPDGISADNQFLICTESLDPVGEKQSDGRWRQADGWLSEIAGNTGSSGRVLLFEPDPARYSDNSVTLRAQLKTRTARFEETVRVAGTSAEGVSPIHVYKSTSFELASYDPFSFGFTVGDSQDGKVALDYADSGTDVEVAFTLASRSGVGEQAVTPVGREFVCYIDAPTLRLPDNHPAEIAEVETGRFAYTVAADASLGTIRIPFVTRSIVSEGTARIYTDDEAIRFVEEEITIENNRMAGGLTYMRDNFNTPKPVPAGEFVVFERMDGTRIGAITMTEEGRYSLRLRSEYAFTWSQTKLRMYYRIDSGEDAGIYIWMGADGSGFTLSELASNPNIGLVAVTE